MKIQCPCCRNVIEVSTGGRPKLSIDVTEVYDAIRLYKTIAAAAKALNCSRAYIYKIFKEHPNKIKNQLSENKKINGPE